MAKPTTLPTWNTDGDNRASPGPGKQATGWAAGERPPVDDFNWLLYWLGAWAAYLDAGALEGDHSIDGDLEATGDALVGGGLHVDNAITTDGAITAGNNQSVTVVGTGDYKHGDKTLTLAPIGNVTGSVAWDFAGNYLGAAAAGTCVVPIPLRVGDRLKTITGRIYGNGSTHVTVRLVVLDGSGGVTVNGGGVAGAQPAAAWTTSATTDGALNHTLAANQAVFAIVDFDGTGRCQTLNIVYDRP